MSLTDAQLFQAYGPKCSGPSLKITLFGGGATVMAPIFGDAMLATDACLRAANYRARPGDTGAFNCRRKKRPDGSYSDEWSTHALKCTFDLNWLTNPFASRLITDYPPQLIAWLEGLRTRSGAPVWSWGGRWARNKDAMHWQAACWPRDLASGIDPRTVPGGNPPIHRPAAPTVPIEEDPPMFTVLNVRAPGHQENGQQWELFPDRTRRCVPAAGNRHNLNAMLCELAGGKVRTIDAKGIPVLSVAFERYRDLTPSADYTSLGRKGDAERARKAGR